MNLFDYYKSHLYESAYNKGYNDYMKGNPNPCSDQEDIYWKDEMDNNNLSFVEANIAETDLALLFGGEE